MNYATNTDSMSSTKPTSRLMAWGIACKPEEVSVTILSIYRLI